MYLLLTKYKMSNTAKILLHLWEFEALADRPTSQEFQMRVSNKQRELEYEQEQEE